MGFNSAFKGLNGLSLLYHKLGSKEEFETHCFNSRNSNYSL